MTETADSAIGSIGRRVDSTIAAMQAQSYEDALIHLFPAVDKTAKRRRPESGVGERICSFISEQQVLITAIAFRNVFAPGCMFDGLTFADAIYKLARTSIIHEGELDARLRITSGNSLRIGKVWELPSSTVSAMTVAVIVSPENAGERSSSATRVSILGEEFEVQSLWGAQSKIEDVVRRVFRRDVFADV
jgi:hypothetical protein